MESALLLQDVSKHYAGHTAVDRLSLEVRRGTIHGLLGPNGAGKSSTLRMIMNIILRDGGDLSVLGSDPERDRDVLRRVGYLPEERGLYKRMTVRDTVVFFGRLKGLGRAESGRRGAEWLERLGLEQWADERTEALSKGMQQKVQFIVTVLHDPELLVLDEPQSGLDPVNQEVLADTIRSARARGGTVVLSTHNMAQAEDLCDEVTLIAGGRKVLEGSVRDLRAGHRGNRYRLELEEGAAPPAAALDPRLVEDMRAGKPNVWELRLAPGCDRDDLLRACLDASLPLLRFEHVEPSLHEIFLLHVGGSAPRAAREERKEAARA